MPQNLQGHFLTYFKWVKGYIGFTHIVQNQSIAVARGDLHGFVKKVFIYDRKVNDRN